MNSLFKGPAWIYHLVLNLPTAAFLWFWLENGQPIIAFIIFAKIDPCIFRTIMDYHRLVGLGKVEEGDYREILKFGTIGYRFKYYGALIFGNR